MSLARATLAAWCVLGTGCVAVRGGPVAITQVGTTPDVGGTVGVRVYDNSIGHFYHSIRPTVGATGNLTRATRSLWRVTGGVEAGLDNFWTDDEHGPWSFRGVFVRGEAGYHTDDVHGGSGLSYYGGGTTVLFRLGGTETLSWGIDATAGAVRGSDDVERFSATGSLLLEWP
jgi:hypothetical protein